MLGFEAHRNAIFDVSWVPGKSQLVTVSGDSTASLWDVGRFEISNDFANISKFEGHSKSVKSVAFKPNSDSKYNDTLNIHCVFPPPN